MNENNILSKSNNYMFAHSLSKKMSLNTFSMHMHNDYEIVFFINGDASLIIEDKHYKLQKNDLIIVEPSKYHYIQINSECDYERYNITFNQFALNISNLNLLSNTFELVNCSDKAIICDLFRKLDYYYYKFDKIEFEDLLACTLKELVYNLKLAHAEDHEINNFKTNPMLSNALKYINENLFEFKNVNDVASNLFISEVYLFKLFKEHLKTTPHKYITEKRLLAAQSMILLGMRPTQAYEKCGYSDYSTFYKNYISYFKHSPSNDYTNLNNDEQSQK